MPKIAYVKRNFSPDVLAMIHKANEIIASYEDDGYALTLRQLFYRFVARNLLPNTERSYKNLGSWINDGRLAGLIDWNSIQDRTRGLEKNSHWTDPADIMKSVSDSYKIDMWMMQKYRPEVWIEKDALVGVIERVCAELDVPYLSCRGYTSQSEMWVGGQRLKRWRGNLLQHQTPVILHFGDHDPSGKDMTRDIVDRLNVFVGDEVELIRLALNMDQIQEYQPPPNPTKVTDSRAEAYIAEFGHECWELDSLEPKVLVELIRFTITKLIDKKQWAQDVMRHHRGQTLLASASERWGEVEKFLKETPPPKKKGKR